MRTFATLLFCLLVAACGRGPSGTYSDALGAVDYTFKSGNKVVIKSLGTEVEMDYSVEADKIKIQMPEGALLMTMQEDGSLKGPMGMTLTKQDVKK